MKTTTIRVSSAAFAAYQEAKERAAAAMLLAEQARADAGIPGTVQLVARYRMRPRTKKDVVLVDENDAPLGKVSLFWQKETIIPAGFRSRLS
jgi:hypothetical protein